MKYIWIISDIYITPSAIHFFPEGLTSLPSPDPRTSDVFPPPNRPDIY